MDGSDQTVPRNASPRGRTLGAQSDSSQVSLARSIVAHKHKGSQPNVASDMAGPTRIRPSRLDSFANTKAGAIKTSPGALSIYSQEQDVSPGTFSGVLEVEDKFPAEPPDQSQYMPNIDSLIEELQIELLSSSDKEHIDKRFRGNILYLLADYVDTQKKLAKKTKAHADLAAEVETLEQNLAYREAAREAEGNEYRAEIKRLELLIHRSSDTGMQAVMLARAGSLLKTKQSEEDDDGGHAGLPKAAAQPDNLVRAAGLGYSTFLDQPRILGPNHDAEISCRLELGLSITDWSLDQKLGSPEPYQPTGITLMEENSQNERGKQEERASSTEGVSATSRLVPYDQTDSSESSASIHSVSTHGQENQGPNANNRANARAKPRAALRELSLLQVRADRNPEEDPQADPQDDSANELSLQYSGECVKDPHSSTVKKLPGCS